MIVAGIDYSITCPAICVFDSEMDFNHRNFLFFVLKKGLSKKEKTRISNLETGWNKNISVVEQSTTECDTERFIQNAVFFLDIIKKYDVQKVFMEAYAFHGKGKVFNLAEATGVLKTLLFLERIPLKVFPPLFVKKVFAGKGNATKETMIQKYEELSEVSLRRLFDVREDFSESPLSDIVDAAAMVYTAKHGGKPDALFLS